MCVQNVNIVHETRRLIAMSTIHEELMDKYKCEIIWKKRDPKDYVCKNE